MELLQSVPPIKDVHVIPMTGAKDDIAKFGSGDIKGHVGHRDVLTYCASGICFYSINGLDYLMRAHQFAYMPKGTWRARMPLTKDLIIYECPILAEVHGTDAFSVLQLETEEYVVDVSDELDEKIVKNFEALLPWTPEREGYFFRAAAICNLIGIYYAARRDATTNKQAFDSVLTHMQTHLDKPVTLPELAELAHMQPTYFIRMFKKTFCRSPIAYYNYMRVSAAMTLLTTTELPLSEIAHRIGIEDRYYFSNFFKSHSGISPDRYRKMSRRLEER